MVTLFNEKDLENIKMECDEKINFTVPDDMINLDGSKNYAYVTLVMLGDLYISAAIVLAHSLRKLNTKSDLVVLVTPDVSEEGKRILRFFYDKIKEIDYVNVKNWRTKKQSHRKYLELVFTKFHLFNLTEYKKVLLIDADAVILKYPDHLFTLDTPAGCLLENKDLIITYDENGNYILPPNGRIKWYDIYCKCCPHGHLIPKYLTDKIYKDYKNSGIGGGLMLLKPKKGEFESIMKDVSHGKMKFLLENRLVWPEQQYLTLRYSGLWHMIDPRFFGLQGYPHYSVLYGLQYGGDKPFVLNSKIDINLRLEFPDFILWHKLYDEILKEYPELKESDSLKETNEFHKFFRVKLKRYQSISSEEQKKLIKQISTKYRIPEHFINKDQLEYYFLDQDLIYRPTQIIEPLFSNIEEYDYMEPIKKLIEYLGNSNNNYYQDILNKYNVPLLKVPLDSFNEIDIHDRDEIMLQYTKSRPNIFIITVWPLAFIKLKEIVNFLEERGNIYYTKIANLSKKGIRSLMFWMYDEFRISNKLEFIEKKLDYTKTKNYDNNIAFIFFDNTKKLSISGQGSSFKKELRNFIVKLVDDSNKNEIRGNDLIHINDYFYQTIEYAQIILNDNTIKALDNQNVNNLNTYNMKLSNLKIQTLRKWLYNNLSLKEISRVLILGSVALYFYGIRSSNDLDGIIINRYDERTEIDLEELIFINLNNRKTKFFFADFGLINSKHWRTTWTDKNLSILKYFNIDSHYDLVFNPKNHMYFNGLKIYLIDFEIVRKIKRLHSVDKSNYNIIQPPDYADFIIMYFYYRNLLKDYVYLDKNNKLKFNITSEKQYQYNNEEKDILSIKIKKYIDDRFPKQQSEKITTDLIKDLLY